MVDGKVLEFDAVDQEELDGKIDAPQTAAVGEVLTVEEIGEDDLQAVYAFLSDLTAELAAISDRPKELADDHWHKVIDKKKQFDRLKNGLKYYSLKNWLEDKKS